MAKSCSLMQFLVLALAAWLSRQQEAVIEYLKAENRMLKGHLGYRRMIFQERQRAVAKDSSDRLEGTPQDSRLTKSVSRVADKQRRTAFAA